MKPSTHDKVQGNTKEAIGAVKEQTGKIVGNERLQKKGQDEKIEGKVQKKVGEIEKVFGS